MVFSSRSDGRPTRRAAILGTAGLVAAGVGLGSLATSPRARADGGGGGVGGVGGGFVMGGDLGMLA